MDISNIIVKSKKKVFKITKNHQIKKFTYLQEHPRYRNTPVPDIIRKKWVINLSSKPLSDGEQSLLQKGPKFTVSSSKVPLTEYIAVTKRICDELSENTAGRGLHRNLPKNQGSSTTLQGKEGPLTTPPERKREAIKTLREDPSHVVLTVDKGVALAVMDKSPNILTNVWPSSMTPRSTNLARTLPRNSTEMSRNPFKGLT